MVLLVRHTSKNVIMESLYKLRGAERRFKSVVIVHDMTLAEREECKRLVAEAKDLTSESESESECKCLTCNQKPTGSQFSLLHEPN